MHRLDHQGQPSAVHNIYLTKCLIQETHSAQSRHVNIIGNSIPHPPLRLALS
uniref:Uncharacterized protein n=1 Tax=Arundo donax TaxID=35708 RepID=A0A0A9TEY4_ARUDO